jgi:hypothetical protein
MSSKDYRSKFSKISDKIPELARETTYDKYYGEATKEDIQEFVVNPIKYLESRGVPDIKGFQVRTTYIHQELIGTVGVPVTSCAEVTVFHKDKLVEVVITAHEEKHTD